MKKILILLSFVLVLIAISTVGYQLVSASDQVDEIQDIISYQENKETYLTPYGYTLDNPNVILNPYGISPLTALILFETEDELPVTVTVKGKDENSTYINSFNSNKRHYIPIYGLYANTINHIQISCGNVKKDISIETEALPFELLVTENIANSSNQLTFITNDLYPYALDNNNEVRWYLTKNYSKKIDYLENGHLLLSNDTFDINNNPNGLVEIDLLGKVYKQYIIDASYLGTYTETTESLFVLSDTLLEIDKQTGTILNSIKLDEQYDKAIFSKKDNTINLSNETNTLSVNLKTNKQTITTTNNPSVDEQKSILPIYNSKENYKVVKGIKFDLSKETKQSNKNIFLVGYKEPDKKYNEYNIEITKTVDNLQIKGNFTKDDEVYIILDKFLDKKVYDITSDYTIINKKGLTGKYSIYISINDTIYKTNNYIKY